MVNSQNTDTIFPSAQMTTATAADQSIWWALPPELREMILKLVYARKRWIKVVSANTHACRLERASRQARREEKVFIPSPFAHYINRFLVSKQWAQEAKAAFLSSSRFDFSWGDSPIAWGNESLNLSFRNVTNITMRMSDVLREISDFALAFPKLKRLRIDAPTWSFEMLVGQEGKLDLLLETVTMKEIRESSWRRPFRLIRGIKEVTFLPLGPNFAKASPACKQRMHKNIDKIKAVLIKSLTRPRLPVKKDALAAERALQQDLATKACMDELEEMMARLQAEKQRLSIQSPALQNQPQQNQPHQLQSQGEEQLKQEYEVKKADSISDEQLPDSLREMQRLLRENPAGVAEWILTARKRLGSSDG